MTPKIIFTFLLFACLSSHLFAQTNPILFCTQVPNPTDFGTLMSTFANHEGTIGSAPRGGDLYICYPDGTLKNLTQAAGYGSTGAMQDENAIAVRDPHVHWSGTKALFSMAIGSPEQYDYNPYRWQIFEITGLGINDNPQIQLVPNQPTIYNNVEPIYGTDERIIFSSDRPHAGRAHLYPQHDEYESTPCVTGLWRIDPTACGALEPEMLTHSPSGDFTPFIDSYGRLVFIRWDHLKRDQQADADIMGNRNNGTFNYADESATAAKSNISPDIEVFPEYRNERTDLANLPEWANTNQHDFNIFNPWMIDEAGTELEMLNHVGRHELSSYFNRNFTNDPNLVEFNTTMSVNPDHTMDMIFHFVESPVTPGLYYGTEAPEFGTHASGMIISIEATPEMTPEDMVFSYITHPETRDPSDNPTANHSGLYRNPIPLTDGNVMVVHTSETRADDDEGTFGNPLSRYDYRLRLLGGSGAYQSATGAFLTGTGISKTVQYFSPDALFSYSGLLWETFPVEVVARTKPPTNTLSPHPLPAIETAMFNSAAVDLNEFKQFLSRNNLALSITRDVTSRDDTDKQQPYNLRVAGSSHQTTAPNATGTIYDVKYLQFLQADYLRGIGGQSSPDPGRRLIAQFMHDETAMRYNLPTTGGQAAIPIEPDGSVAAIVPAERALAWQLTDPTEKGIVRERVWLSFAAGEVRVCTSCHGESELNQAGNLAPTNSPQALTKLLNHIKVLDSDNDGAMDIADFYPNDANLQMGQAIDENFVNNLADWVADNEDNDAVSWDTEMVDECHTTAAVVNNQASNAVNTLDHLQQTVDLTHFRSAFLQFEVAYAAFDANRADALQVSIQSCGSNASTTVFSKAGTELATVANQTQLFTPTCDDWRSECVDVSAFIGQQVELTFTNVSDHGNQLFIDNIRLAESACGTALPIAQVDLQANWTARNTVVLEWSTRNDEATQQFVVERSVAGNHWNSIGTVAVNETSKYQFIDKNPFLKINYYRLQLIDNQSNTNFSKVVSVTKENDFANQLTIFPNPVEQTLQWQFTNRLNLEESVVATIFTVDGKQIWREKFATKQSIEVKTLPSGIYQLQIETSNEKWMERFVKK
ncbi:MAG: T9SS type A sorting domain-containing protein [Saprospiraceae bacterium]